MLPITLENITKTYEKGKVVAVDDVSFSVKDSEMFGLIGPDGAGKTSIFRMLTTLLLPDKGNASVCGYDIVKDYKAIRGIVGYMPGRFSLYQDLTVEENLDFFASVFKTSIKENYELIRDIYVQLEPFKNRRAGKLSGGMKQKLALCCALIHKPSVLFLDEPTTGVDAVSRMEFWEMLKRLKNQGITILVSTAYMDEVGHCDRIALMQTGKILSLDTPGNIIEAFPERLFAIATVNKHQVMKDLVDYKDAFDSYPSGEFIHISFPKNGTTDTEIMSGVKEFLLNKGITDIGIKPAIPSIEDCFLSLIKH
jgi:ABC-2 type transport system ATP-binding protein